VRLPSGSIVKACTAVLVLVLCAALAARAEIPAGYSPMVLQAPAASVDERVFDLTAAFRRARDEGKPLLVYLGAPDCPPCREYTQFLRDHEAALAPLFAKAVVVDIRTSIRGPRPTFVLDGRRYSVAEFKALIGNTDPGLSYPTLWLIGPRGRQLRALPRGVDQLLDVASYAQWLATR
jgi:thiol-disulfide isomerase/thioredoxin